MFSGVQELSLASCSWSADIVLPAFYGKSAARLKRIHSLAVTSPVPRPLQHPADDVDIVYN